MVRDVVEIDRYSALIEKVYAFHTDLCVLCDRFFPLLFRFCGGFVVLIREHLSTINTVSLMWLIHLSSYDIL